MASSGYFSPLTLKFLKDLRNNNNREWFQENKSRGEEHMLAPARELITAVGELLRRKRPDIIADPRTDRSIYRLNRDTRFSRDKTPYKTHLAMWWWEGEEGRLECPGFYLHLDPDFVAWSVGCYRFSDQGLANWRAMLGDPKKAAAFGRLAKSFQSAGFDFCAPELKRVPAGYAADHPQGAWLRHKGLYSWNQEYPHPRELFSDEAAEFIFSRFKQGLAFQGRMVEILAGR